MKDFARLWKSCNQECCSNLGSRRKVDFHKKEIIFAWKTYAILLALKNENMLLQNQSKYLKVWERDFTIENYSFGDLCKLHRGGKTRISKWVTISPVQWLGSLTIFYKYYIHIYICVYIYIYIYKPCKSVRVKQHMDITSLKLLTNIFRDLWFLHQCRM